MSVKIKGLNDLQRNLKKMERKAKSMDGSHSVPFTELFNSKFMKKNTKFSSIEQFVDKSEFDFSNMESINEHDLDNYVKKNTKFNSWDSMKGEAAQLWTAKQLGF